jgi:hypothetical protein
MFLEGILNRICYGNGLYIITTDTNNKIYKSTDLVNWTSQTINGKIRGLAYGNGMWVIGCNTDSIFATDNKLYISTDNGNTWQVRNIKYNIDTLIYANNVWFRVGAGYHYSTDLVNWTSHETNKDWRGVAYGNGRWVIVGNYDPNLSAMPKK